MMKSLKTFCALSALAAALVACGGGGGGGGGDGGTDTPGDVVASTGTLQITVPASTYANGGNEASAYDRLNAVRQAAGAGLVAQSSAMDIAATAHAKYLTTNITSGIVHTEDSTKTDYYETSPTSRLTKAGFSAGFTTEVIGGTGASLEGEDCILGLLNTVYHGAALLSQATNVGVGFGTDGAGIPLCVADLATLSTETYAQVSPSDSLVAYPYGGQTDVLETFYVDFESPRPSVTLFPNATAGTPVIVSVRNADFVNFNAAGTLSVSVTKFELKDAGGNLVPVGILANSGISGAGVTLTADGNLDEGFVVLVPLSPLAKGVTHTATFTATLKADGAPVTKTWSFTTNP